MTLTETEPLALAIDIGGTKTAFGILEPSGRLVREIVIPTPRGDPDQVLADLIDQARSAIEGFRVVACGIDLPAVVANGVVQWAAWSFPGWDGLPLAERFQRSLGIPCVLEFDGYAAALGEIWQGRARGCRDAAVVIVGTGVGAGFVHAGELYRGARGVAGAIGWLRFPEHDQLGQPMEDTASGTAILRRARSAHPQGDSAYADTAAVFDASTSGDPRARRAVRDAMLALAAGVGALVAMLAPEIVVLGGSVGARPDVVEEVRSLVLSTTQPYAAGAVVIDSAALGARSSLYGAGYLAHRLVGREEPK